MQRYVPGKHSWAGLRLGESLRRFHTTPFTWSNACRDSWTEEGLEVLDSFTILANLKIVRRKTDGHITKEGGYFRFHD
jgi:hypothetical protein